MILKEKEQGYTVAELCRQHGFSEATYYNWKSKYSGMTVNELSLKVFQPALFIRFFCLN